MTKIVFATCRLMPDMQPDDVPLADALQARGAHVTVAPWNGPFEPFATAHIVAVRSPWDYPEHGDAFEQWLHRLDDIEAVTGNSPSLMRWNTQKTYLLDLADRGAPLPPTRVVARDATAIAAAMHELELAEAVVKPIVGAGASGLSVVTRDDVEGLERAAAKLTSDALVQPLIPEIRTHGEASLVFFAGEFSHAVVKLPGPQSILVQAEHGGETTPMHASDAAIDVARSVLRLLPEQPLYARVDMVLSDERALLMELELIEPELFLHYGKHAAERFADLMLAQLAR